MMDSRGMAVRGLGRVFRRCPVADAGAVLVAAFRYGSRISAGPVMISQASPSIVRVKMILKTWTSGHGMSFHFS